MKSVKNFTALYPQDAGYDQAKFKIMIHGVGDPKDRYVSNDLRFPTEDDAKAYGNDLSSRWMGMDDWRVEQVN